MPKINDKQFEQLHTSIKIGQKSHLHFEEQLQAINVNIIDAPSVHQFRRAISVFMMNTWNDFIHFDFDETKIDDCIHDMFMGNILPTGQEIIGITWTVDGLNLIDTTHLIRHRMFSFSAQTHADRDMRDDKCLVPASILANHKFADRYKAITRQAMELYVDMTDSGEVHCLDTRTIMPRNIEHFYSVRCCIKDLIAYVQMRADEQIQTTVDNIIALKLWLEVLKRYPFLKQYVNFNGPDMYYVRQCSAGKTSIFPPNKKNDVFEYNPGQFIHDKHRDEFPGGDVYLAMRADLMAQIAAI